MHTPNSYVSVDTTLTAQLTYVPRVDPAPLTVSVPNQPPTLGSLEIIVTNQRSVTLEVESVQFTIKVGSGDALTPTTQGILTAVSDVTNWQVIGPFGTVTGDTATYTLQPATGSSVSMNSGQSVVVQIYNFETVTSPATTSVTIKESVGGFTNFGGFDITTYPYGFYFDSLIATAGSGGNFTPVAQVANPTPVTLIWNSSVVDSGAFKIYYSSATQGQQTATPVYSGQWTSPAITGDTVFTVVVAVTTTGGTPLTAAMSVTVSVQNPDLVANSLAAVNITVQGVVGGFGTVPIGAVLDWWVPAGSILMPPANFVICDGRMISDPASPFNGHNAPNLVQKFAYGVNAVADIGKTGGSADANVSITCPLPGTTGAITGSAPSWANSNEGTIIRNNPCTKYRFSMTDADVDWNDGQHVHNLGGSVTGSTTISTVPPYVCLLKILRIK